MKSTANQRETARFDQNRFITRIWPGLRRGLMVMLVGGMLFQGVGCLGALVPAAISLAESNLLTFGLQFLTNGLL